MTPDESACLRRVLKSYSGIVLGPEKQDLLDLRVRRLLKEHEMDSVGQLCAALSRSDGESLRWRLSEVLAVQESYFFRDKTVFETLERSILPALVARRPNRRLRIWCAAAATGQEPYSLAMMVAEHAAMLDGWTVEILATDFSEEALMKARAGLYSQFEVQRGLPVRLLVKYFRRVEGGWELDPAIRQMVTFRQQNLLHNSRRHGVFDLILCRNVLIYFDEATKRDVLSRLAAQLAQDGYLVLGATETVFSVSRALGPLAEPCPGVFRHVAGDFALGVLQSAEPLEAVVPSRSGLGKSAVA